MAESKRRKLARFARLLRDGETSATSMPLPALPLVGSSSPSSCIGVALHEEAHLRAAALPIIPLTRETRKETHTNCQICASIKVDEMNHMFHKKPHQKQEVDERTDKRNVVDDVVDTTTTSTPITTSRLNLLRRIALTLRPWMVRAGLRNRAATRSFCSLLVSSRSEQLVVGLFCDCSGRLSRRRRAVSSRGSVFWFVARSSGRFCL